MSEDIRDISKLMAALIEQKDGQGQRTEDLMAEILEHRTCTTSVLATFISDPDVLLLRRKEECMTEGWEFGAERFLQVVKSRGDLTLLIALNLLGTSKDDNPILNEHAMLEWWEGLIPALFKKRDLTSQLRILRQEIAKPNYIKNEKNLPLSLKIIRLLKQLNIAEKSNEMRIIEEFDVIMDEWLEISINALSALIEIIWRSRFQLEV